mmetsp:Transcript_13562/g.37368  ORF Transcript_13562/g.37368 Transcript_13562/m.37368 type:complete len:231 (+) Transcript_13562:427-1119(+)
MTRFPACFLLRCDLPKLPARIQFQKSSPHVFPHNAQDVEHEGKPRIFVDRRHVFLPIPINQISELDIAAVRLVRLATSQQHIIVLWRQLGVRPFRFFSLFALLQVELEPLLIYVRFDFHRKDGGTDAKALQGVHDLQVGTEMKAQSHARPLRDGELHEGNRVLEGRVVAADVKAGSLEGQRPHDVHPPHDEVKELLRRILDAEKVNDDHGSALVIIHRHFLNPSKHGVEE